MPPSKPGSSQQPGPPPDITPNARETQGAGRGRAGGCRTDPPCAAWGESGFPADGRGAIFSGEQGNLAARRRRCDLPVTGCGIVSGAAACEVIDALTPGCFWAFKGCCSSFSPDLLQVLTDGLFVWIKHPQCCKYNYSLKPSRESPAVAGRTGIPRPGAVPQAG